MISKREYWYREFDKFTKEYDLAVKERRKEKFMKENRERIAGLYQLCLESGCEALNEFYVLRGSNT